MLMHQKIYWHNCYAQCLTLLIVHKALPPTGLRKMCWVTVGRLHGNWKKKNKQKKVASQKHSLDAPSAYCTCTFLFYITVLLIVFSSFLSLMLSLKSPTERQVWESN